MSAVQLLKSSAEIRNATVSTKLVNSAVLSGVRELVASSLAKGDSEQLYQNCQHYLTEDQSNAVWLQLDIIHVCLATNRKRAARNWVEKMEDEPSLSAYPEALVDALATPSRFFLVHDANR